ncbi:MAG: FtsX-like permease family protein [Candidatus Competibacteraceae bacterium]
MLIRILFRNAFRHKLRTLLTICGMAVAILAFCLLQTVIDAWYAGVAASSSTRLISRNAISLVFSLPLFYKDRIRQVDGVTIVSYGNWFGGYYQDPKNFFANFAIEPRSYLELYPEFVISDTEKTAFLRDRRGVAVGRKLAERFGWKLGDEITLKGTIFPGDWPMVIRAIYTGRDKTVDETQLFFHWDYLNETQKQRLPAQADRIGFYIIGVRNPDRAAEISEAVDTLFKNSTAETLTETEKAFQLSFVAMSETILTAVRLVAIVVIVIILVVVANTMAMSVRERLWEYAVFKTLGFVGHQIALLILGESLVITLLGGALGIALTFPLASAFGRAVGTFFPTFNVAPLTLYLALAAAVSVGVVAALLPARQAVKVGIAAGLRRVV